MFCIEIILEQGLLLFQDKKNVLDRNNTRTGITIILGQKECFCPRNNSNPYPDISSIQTFSLSYNTRTWISIILGQKECFVQK